MCGISLIAQSRFQNGGKGAKLKTRKLTAHSYTHSYNNETDINERDDEWTTCNMQGHLKYRCPPMYIGLQCKLGVSAKALFLIAWFTENFSKNAVAGGKKKIR